MMVVVRFGVVFVGGHFGRVAEMVMLLCCGVFERL